MPTTWSPCAREADADDAGGVAAHRPHLALVEARDAALGRRQHDVVVARTRPPTHASASSSATVMARMPVERTRSNCSMGVFLMMPLRVAITRLWPFSKSGSVMTASTRSPDSTWTPSRLMMGMPLAWRVASGHRVDLGAEHAAAVGEEQRPVVGVGDEQVRDRVLLDRARADDALAAARLAPVRDQRLALDVAAARDRDDHVLVGDEVLVGELRVGVVLDARAALAGVLRSSSSLVLVLDDLQHAPRVGEDVLELGDELDDRDVLVLDLLALERGEAPQLHLEDRVGLDLGEPEPAHEVWRARRPRPPTRGWSRMTASRLSSAILRPFEDVGPVARLLEVELGAPPDDLAAPVDVVLEDRLERQRLGLAVDERHDVGVEGQLQRACA